MLPHSFLRRFVSLLLAALVLTASVGLTVQRQTCRMSGRSLVAVSVASAPARWAGCGGRPVAAGPLVKKGCCDFQSHLHKLSAPAHDAAAGNVLLPAPLPAAWLLPVANFRAARFSPRALKTGLWWLARAPAPPLGGREFLVFACTLVV